MAADAILKSLKIAISRPRFDRSWRNLAWWWTGHASRHNTPTHKTTMPDGVAVKQ